MRTIIVLAILVLFIKPSCADDFVLVKNGKPVAMLAQVNNDSLLRVANLFNKYIREITGTELEIKTLIGGYQVTFYLISPEELPNYPKFNKIKDKDILGEAFSIYENRGFLFFSATTIKGLENGVYAFMEKYAGVRFYAHNAIVIPSMSTLAVPEMDLFEAPAFAFRAPYYYEATFQDYIDFHKLSASPKDTENPSWPVSKEWGLWVHTMHKLLPPDKLFEEHPEYFALRNGIRMSDQACLSNPEVFEIVCQNLENEIKANPSAKYWSVSQMDNFNYCECDKCRFIDSIEGSPSGTLIRFINQVANRFPDKVISTLAYQYTRKAPAITKPLTNVNIMLCTIECNRNLPIESDTLAGSFYNDLKSWSTLTNNILVWDYVINFSHLLAPFPNFQVLAPNLQLFAKSGVKMMFEQGLRGCSSGEFSELRCYLLSKLMWNPFMNADSLMSDFIIGYYGLKAGPFINEYIRQMTQNLAKSGKALTLYEPPFTHSTGYLSPANLKNYFALFNYALEACKNDSIATQRVQMAMQSIRYAWLEVSKSLPFSDDWIFEKDGTHQLKQSNMQLLNDLVDRALVNGPSLFHETSLSPEEYHNTMKDYFANGIVHDKAVGAKVSYTLLPDDPYQANGLQSLVDGVKGTTAYQMLWQGWWGKDLDVIIILDTIQTVNEVKVGYLDNNQSWIIAPEAVEVSVSEDGVNYITAGSLSNIKAGEKQPVYISSLCVKMPHALKTQYLRVKVINYGKLPVWRGINANSWLFVDEIEVY
ncbi:MAG TPA: DUF4838 domain-containing protein [Lentimicrobium sp.]|nr:DUF4838 domain-containing protein [Lentimicrobium sp.]